MRRRGAPVAVAAVLAALVVYAGRSARTVERGVELVPGELVLRVGDGTEVALLSHEREMVAFSFRLRFDPAVIRVEEPRPEEQDVLAGGNALVLPIHEAPGAVDVPGVAVTGGRTFKPATRVYRFRVRAVAPGVSRLAVESFTLVDVGEARRDVRVAPARVTVRAP